MIRTLLFDLGGTLFDFSRANARCDFRGAARRTYDLLRARGHSLPPFNRYYRSQYGSVVLAYAKSLLAFREFNVFNLLCANCRKLRLDLDEPTLRELARLWYEPVTKTSSVAADVVPALTRFRDRGYDLVIVSNTFLPGFLLDEHLLQHGLLEFFTHRIYSSEIGKKKPHPLPFRLALQAVNAMPEEAVFIGDTVATDIKGAHRVGIRTVLRSLDGRTHPLADHTVRRISELHHLLPAIPAVGAVELPGLDELACEI